MRNIIILACLCATGAVAQPVWRCGNSYGSQPCEGGSVLPAARPATATEAAKARAIGKTDAQLGAALEQARLKREKEAPKAVVPKPAAAPASSASKPAAKKNKKEPEFLTAVEPAARKK